MLRQLLCLVGLSAPSLAAAAEPILMPDFTSVTANEFAVTVMLQNQVSDRLLADGHMVLTSDVVAPVVGAEAVTACANQPACPQQVLPKLPSRIAVVVRVGRVSGTLVGRFELWEQTRPTPVIERDVAIAPGQEHLFAQDISVATAHVISQLGPSTDAVRLAAARLIAGQSVTPQPPPAARPAPAPAPAPVPVPAPIVARPAPAPAPVAPVAPVKATPGSVPVPRAGGRQIDPNATTAERLEGTGVKYRHVIGSERNFRNAGLDPRDWMYKAMPHAGRVAFELRAGLGMGDVDRQGDMRVELLGGQARDRWYQEGPIQARRPMGSIYIGYAPATMFDIGVLAGFQYGRRQLTTGYARVGQAGVDEVSTPPKSVDAAQFHLQPRLRTYVVPTGPAKPFLVAGADFRIFNRYELEQPDSFEYPLPEGGLVPGFAGGAGLMIDPSPIVGFFFEGSYTHHFGHRAVATQSGIWTYRAPDAPVGLSYTIGLVGGVQIRI